MSGISEAIEIAPADLRKLDRAIDKMGDTGLLMRAVGGYVRDATRQRFRDSKAPDGTTWPISVRAKAKGGKTLVKSARLRDSIIDHSTADKAEVGTNVIYAAAHQFGLSEPQPVAEHNRRIKQAFGRPLPFPVWQTVGAFSRTPNTPARPFLGVNGEDRVEITGLVQDFIDMAAAA